MIRVKLLSEPDYRTLLWTQGAFRAYEERQFYDLLREKGDFTDAESLALLRHLHGEEAVAGKWYRRTTAAGTPCIPAISPEAMYGLVVLENSRKGCYTPIEEAFTDFEVEQRMEGRMEDHHNPLIWQVFAQLDLDILLTFRKKEFSFAWEIPIEEEFILENYPLNGVPTEVRVVHDYFPEPELRDGEWCVQNFFYDLKYQWDEDADELLKTLEQELADRTPLLKGLFPLHTFEAMCQSEESFNRIRDEQEAPPQFSWRVLNHMDRLPPQGESRRLLYLIIETYDDGQYCLREEISVKYPNYMEMLSEAIEAARPDCETFVMPVDVNECMGSAEDICKAVCAFRLHEGVIETFDKTEGLRVFERTLRGAVKPDVRTQTESGDGDAETLE